MTEVLLGRLRTALREAMRARDADAVRALRSAIAAVGNAEAVPVDTLPRAGAVEQSAVGAYAADAPRRALSNVEVRGIVEGEVAERVVAAIEMDRHGRTDEAALLRTEADVICRILDT